MRKANFDLRDFIKIGGMALIIILEILFYNLTNRPEFRDTGYLYVMGIVSMGLFLTAFALTTYLRKGMKWNAMFLFAFPILRLILMMLYIPYGTEFLTYYFNLALVSGIIVIMSLLDNVLDRNKNEDDGFKLNMYAKDSPLPDKLLPIFYIGIFIVMGLIIGQTGQTFIPRPTLSTEDGMKNAIISSWGVAQWENISFIFFPAEFISYLILLIAGKRKKQISLIDLVFAVLVGALFFMNMHNFRYALNTTALMAVFFFGIIAMLSYKFLKTTAIADAIHDGNNFWGSYFNATVIGMSVFGIGGSGSLLSSILLLSPLIILIGVYAYWRKIQ